MFGFGKKTQQHLTIDDIFYNNNNAKVFVDNYNNDYYFILEDQEYIKPTGHGTPYPFWTIRGTIIFRDQNNQWNILYINHGSIKHHGYGDLSVTHNYKHVGMFNSLEELLIDYPSKHENYDCEYYSSHENHYPNPIRYIEDNITQNFLNLYDQWNYSFN